MLLGVVLAAGTSSRMGKNKLALPWGKRTVLEATMRVVDSYAFNKKMVVLGYERDYWFEKWNSDLENNTFLWDIVENPLYRQGQGTSVAKVGEHLCLNFALQDYEGAMFFLGDQPMLEEETICQLVEAWEADKEKIVVPTYQGQRGNPTIFPKWTFSALMKLTGDAGPRAMLEEYPERVCFVEVEDPGIVLDLDTEEAYREALARAGK